MVLAVRASGGVDSLYRKHLISGGAMKADADWFREMWLYYCRNLHVWDSEPVEWRGGCHRSLPEAFAKGRAAAWYPDIPEAANWKRYSELVFADFWKAKEVPQNDTGYMTGPLNSLPAAQTNGPATFALTLTRA